MFIAQYNIPKASKSAPGNKLGIYESLDVHYSRADLDVYYSQLYPCAPHFLVAFSLLTSRVETSQTEHTQKNDWLTAPSELPKTRSSS